MTSLHTVSLSLSLSLSYNKRNPRTSPFSPPFPILPFLHLKPKPILETLNRTSKPPVHPPDPCLFVASSQPDHPGSIVRRPFMTVLAPSQAGSERRRPRSSSGITSTLPLRPDRRPTTRRRLPSFAAVHASRPTTPQASSTPGHLFPSTTAVVKAFAARPPFRLAAVRASAGIRPPPPVRSGGCLSSETLCAISAGLFILPEHRSSGRSAPPRRHLARPDQIRVSCVSSEQPKPPDHLSEPPTLRPSAPLPRSTVAQT